MRNFMEMFREDNVLTLKLVFPDAEEAIAYAEDLTEQLRAGDRVSISFTELKRRL